MNIEEKLYCPKCGRTMGAKMFYSCRDKSKTDLCKKCLTMHVDPFTPDTFTWILKKLDTPYVPWEWDSVVDKEFNKDPSNVSGMVVMGKYLAKMKLGQWTKKGWDDSSQIIAEREAQQQIKESQKKVMLENAATLYENGAISEAEYKTLTSAKEQYENLKESGALSLGADNPYDETQFMPVDDLPDPAADLTQEDKIYLAMKWGRLYKPNEWVELERKYNEMMKSFDIQDSDTIGTLILICKTFLKLNQAIDCGDLEGYQKLSRTYDTLRKSAKFTAAQKKEEKNDFIDSIGQMVAYCEKEGGKIPRFEIKADLDIVDKVIKDLKEYNKTLIYEDTALARQIEEYLKRKEVAENIKRDKELAKINNEEYTMDDEDIRNFNQLVEEEKQSDYKTLYGKEDDDI